MDTKELISKLIDDIVVGNSSDAGETFNTVIGAKLTDALDVKKVEVAQSIYSTPAQEDESNDDEV